MKSLFISYRRKDTQDVVGRVFDRLSGYFGPGLVLLDVDALVAGGNYRNQIAGLLKNCSVVLAVIGREWLTTTNDSGVRRLDDPDDQLRIELEVALAEGRTIIPVLVHDAAMPTAAELPDSLQPLASLEPHYVQSGTSFTADMRHLIVRLGDAGVYPPETKFPWHVALMTAGILCILATFALNVGSSYDRDDDFILQQIDPTATLTELQSTPMSPHDDEPYTLARYDAQLRREAWQVYLPLAIGPMLIVWGKRKCCLNKERNSARRHYFQGAGRLPIPKSRLSVWCLALGMASLAAGAFTAVPAAVVGAFAWSELRKRPTWLRGRSLVVFGLLAAGAGVLISMGTQWPRWRLRTWLAAMETVNATESAGDDERALAALERAKQAATSEPRGMAVTELRRGEALQRLEKGDEAVAAFTTAIELVEEDVPELSGPSFSWEEPVWARARSARGEIYESQGKSQEAQEDFHFRDWGLFNRQGAIEALKWKQPPDGSDSPPPPPPPAPVPAPSAEEESIEPSAARPRSSGADDDRLAALSVELLKLGPR